MKTIAKGGGGSMRRNIQRRWLLSVAIFLLGTLFACQTQWDGSYEVVDYQCYDSSFGNVLFLYPNFVEYSVLGRMQSALPDEPAIVFEYLSQIDRFIDWHHATDETDDLVYLAGSCGPQAIFYEGESHEKPEWHRYSIVLAEIRYYELRPGTQGVLVDIPFPIHLLPIVSRRNTVTLYEYDNSISADFDVLADFAAKIEIGILDSEERTLTYTYPNYNLSLMIVDQGDGTIRVLKKETTS